MSVSDSELITEKLGGEGPPLVLEKDDIAESLAEEAMQDVDMIEANNETLVYVVRHKESEVDMIRSLAAETIQESYKRYMECKSSVRAAQVRRENAEVERMAADTIKGALRFHISRRMAAVKLEESGNSSKQEQTPVKSNVAEDEDDNLPLPENWERRYDDVKGRYYYVDHTNKRTQWRHPLSKRKPKSSAKKNRDKSESPVVVETGSKAQEHSDVAAGAEMPVIVTSKDTALELSPVVLNMDEATEQPADIEADLEMKVREPEVGQIEIDIPDEEAQAIGVEEEPPQLQAGPVSDLPPAKVSDSVSVESFRRRAAPAIEPSIPISGSADHLVVDEALSIAFQEQCVSVRFKPREVLLLLDALDCDVPPALLESSHKLSSSIPSVELPVLHAGPLASVLTTYVRNYGLVANSRSFTLPESQAELAVGRICGLVSGVWSQAFPTAALSTTDPNNTIRSQVLSNCDGSRGKAARPVFWSERQVKAALDSMGFDAAKFTGFTGEDLLSFEVSRVESEMGVTQSLLLARFTVYQQVLQLLDKWWELGHRPGDTYREVYRSAFLGSLMLPFRGPSVSAPASSEPSSEKAPRAPRNRQRKRRGSFQGLRKATESKFKWGNVDAKQGESVELAPLESLMRSWVPLNRAYGWGVPLETLTLMGGRIGGKRGTIEADIEPSAVQGCCWVSVRDEGARQSLASLEELQIVRALPVSAEGSLVLVPQMCLRKADDSATQVGAGEGQLNPASVTPGMLVEVANRKVLERAFDRFEWWDRPPPDALVAMTAQTAEIISTNELESRRRVGVRILNSDIFDAIPLEALLPVTVAQPASVSAAATEEQRQEPSPAGNVTAPKISARVSVKRNTAKDKGSKKSIAMAPKSAGYTPPFTLAEEGPEQCARVRPSTAPVKRVAMPRGKTEIVAGESEKVVNEYYLSELRSPLGHPFQVPEGCDEAVPESSPTLIVEAPVREPPTEAVVMDDDVMDDEEGEIAADEPMPAVREQRPVSPARLSTSTLQFDSKNARWAMPSSPGKAMPGKKRSVSPTMRRGQKGRKDVEHNAASEEKEKDPSLFVQEIGLDELTENCHNGATASPEADRRRKEKQQRRQNRPSTAGPQRVVGRPVLASRDDVVEWVDGSAFFVAGNAKLGARQID